MKPFNPDHATLAKLIQGAMAFTNDGQLSTRWVNLTGINRSNLVEINLSHQDLRCIPLQEAALRGADLQEANLRWADLRWADLTWANLYKANLQKAKLQKAYLQGANLRGADLRGADLQGANLRGAALQGADLQGAKFSLNSDSEILSTAFKEVKNFDKAVFYDPDGKKIEGLKIDEETGLITYDPKPEGFESALTRKFGEEANNYVHAADIMPNILDEHLERVILPENHPNYAETKARADAGMNTTIAPDDNNAP